MAISITLTTKNCTNFRNQTKKENKRERDGVDYNMSQTKNDSYFETKTPCTTTRATDSTKKKYFSIAEL